MKGTIMNMRAQEYHGIVLGGIHGRIGNTRNHVVRGKRTKHKNKTEVVNHVLE